MGSTRGVVAEVGRTPERWRPASLRGGPHSTGGSCRVRLPARVPREAQLAALPLPCAVRAREDAERPEPRLVLVAQRDAVGRRPSCEEHRTLDRIPAVVAPARPRVGFGRRRIAIGLRAGLRAFDARGRSDGALLAVAALAALGLRSAGLVPLQLARCDRLPLVVVTPPARLDPHLRLTLAQGRHA